MSGTIKKNRSGMKRSRSNVKSMMKTDSRPFQRKINMPDDTQIESEVFPKWDEMKEEMEVDNFIYGLEDEVASKAMETIKRKHQDEERIEGFVDSFCKAWVKLVRWRWMVKDVEGIDVATEDDEPVTCPEDPWSSHSVVEKKEERRRTSLPPPAKCCTHPPFAEAELISVEKPVMERMQWIVKRSPDMGKRHSDKSKIDTRSVMSTVDGSSKQMVTRQLELNTPKTAFPEVATAKITLSPRLADIRNKKKNYTSEVNLLDKY